MPLKKDLRVTYKQLRLSLSKEQREAYSVSICDTLLDSGLLDGARMIHVFLPMERMGEPDTFPLVHALWERNKDVAVSVSDFSHGTMSHFLLTPATRIENNSYGIPEPVFTDTLRRVEEKEIDAVIVPLLCCDERGRRVGYGRGFYDRFLKECRDDVLRVGISFFPPVSSPIEDVREDDIPLTHLCTPQGIITFDIQ